ncbi:MAG: protein kinase [Eubacteriaceae bacterium]|nr:protein kinase [Eubacteriaceae bacterium]
MIGKIIDNKYEIIEQLGSGGMAKVYRAKDLRLERSVAVKVLKEEYADNEQFVNKFMKEARADAMLAHHNIVGVYDVGEQEGLPYIVMEYIDGPTLKKYIEQNGPIEPSEAVDILYSVTLGVANAHKNGIIHRDIKPQNILLTSNRVPKVADFGIATAITSTTLTATEEALGSVHYVSPEQARGGFLDERSDLYSLGIMMYEMLTASLPYDGDTPVAVALMHVQNDVPSPRRVNKKLPEGVCQLVLNLTRRKTEDRYQNAVKLLSDLKLLKANIDAQIKPTYGKGASGGGKKTSPGGKPVSGPGRRLAIFIIAGVLLAAACAALIYIYEENSKVAVPPLEGATISEAKEILTAAELDYYVIQFKPSAEIEEGRIISQTPAANQTVKKGSAVGVVVSSGPRVIRVSAVIGFYEAEAVSKLTKAGFDVSEIKYENNSEYGNGQVFAQSPEGGTQVVEGTKVILYVSLGKDSTTVPNLLGKTIAEAKTLLSSAGLNLSGNITYEPSNSYSAGLIFKQTPTAYSEADKNTEVVLVVSLGNLITKTIDYKVKSADVKVEISLQDKDGNYISEYLSGSTENAGKKITVSVTRTPGTYSYVVTENGIQTDSGSVSF